MTTGMTAATKNPAEFESRVQRRARARRMNNAATVDARGIKKRIAMLFANNPEMDAYTPVSMPIEGCGPDYLMALSRAVRGMMDVDVGCEIHGLKSATFTVTRHRWADNTNGADDGRDDDDGVCDGRAGHGIRRSDEAA